MLTLWAFGADGHVTRVEVFDADREAEALARFDELGPSAEGPATPSRAARIENAATRYSARFMDAWGARDWERVAALHAPECRVMDRRKMVRVEFDRGGQLESLRFLFAFRSSRWTAQLLATRGDRLALGRVRFEASDGDAGPSDVEVLQVTEVDDHGDAVAFVVFDPDDSDLAYAELDRRYAAGEAAADARALEASKHFERAPVTKPSFPPPSTRRRRPRTPTG
jgi:hypothetical protein